MPEPVHGDSPWLLRNQTWSWNLKAWVCNKAPAHTLTAIGSNLTVDVSVLIPDMMGICTC